MASALAVAAVYPDALMIDVGSTTADVVPIAAGRVAAAGRTDLDRLLAGELVYTGALRTNLAAIAPRVPVRGGSCPVASELFAISADVQLILGHLAPGAYTCATPDGRPATVEFARERVARLVCADAEQLAAEEIDAIAAFLHAEQVRQIEAAVRRVSGRFEGAPPVVPLGAGAFLAREAAEHLGRAVVELPWSAAERDAAPAAALAELLAGRLRPRVLTVVKVGGGLAREAGDGALRTLCRAIGDAGARHPLLVVPGGAAFADAVREHDGRFALRAATAHRMAILAMDQFGWLLSDLIPGAVPCTDLPAARAAAARGATPILLPAALLAGGPAARLVGGHVRLDRRLGGRCRACRAPGARQAGRRPLPRLAGGRRAARSPERGRARRAARGGASRGSRRAPAGGAARGRRRGVGDRRPRAGSARDAARARQHRGDARDPAGLAPTACGRLASRIGHRRAPAG